MFDCRARQVKNNCRKKKTISPSCEEPQGDGETVRRRGNMARGLCWDGGGGAGAGCGLRGLESAGRGCDVPWRSWWSLEASQRVPPAGRGGTSGAVHLGAEGRGRVAGRPAGRGLPHPAIADEPSPGPGPAVLLVSVQHPGAQQQRGCWPAPLLDRARGRGDSPVAGSIPATRGVAGGATCIRLVCGGGCGGSALGL